MQQELTDCMEQAQKYYEVQDMNGLEQAMRRWEQLLGQARSMEAGSGDMQKEEAAEQDVPLWLELSEMWFQQLNGALYEGASMMQEALECYQKAGDLANEAFFQVEEKAEYDENVVEQGCECIRMTCILYRTYMKCMETGKAAQVIRITGWMFDTLYPLLSRNPVEGTLAAEMMLDVASAQTACGDGGGAAASLSKAEKLYQELYRISDKAFHQVMALRTREMILMLRLQIQMQPIEEAELQAVERQLQAYSACGRQQPEYGLVRDGEIILLVLRGFGAAIRSDMRQMEAYFTDAIRKVDELIAYLRTSHPEEAFLSRVNQETFARLCNYQIACREQLGSSKTALGKLTEAAETYKEALQLLTMPDCTFAPLEQQRMSGRLGATLGLICLETDDRSAAEFYLNRAVTVQEEVARATGLEADRAACEETRQQAARLAQPEKLKKQSFWGRILGR